MATSPAAPLPRRTTWPLGVVASFALAVPAWELGRIVPVVGAPIFAILIGIGFSLFRRPAVLEDGIKLTGKKVLQYSIVFLGFSLDLGVVLRVGEQSLAVMIFTLAAAFLVAAMAGRALGLAANTKILIGVGTSICGGSAIAAAAPVINADEKDVSYSISTIFLFNIVAVFLFPALGHLLGLSDHQFGIWAGTAINDTSSVVAAAFSYSDTAGSLATIVKLTRTLMIVPVTVVLAVAHTRAAGRSPAAGRAGGGTAGRTGGRLSLARIFPWFVLGFVAASLVRTLGLLPNAMSSALNETGKFGITAAMAAIGLNTRPRQLVQNGVRPILLGLACWAAVALVSLAVQRAGL